MQLLVTCLGSVFNLVTKRDGVLQTEVMVVVCVCVTWLQECDRKGCCTPPSKAFCQLRGLGRG